MIEHGQALYAQLALLTTFLSDPLRMVTGYYCTCFRLATVTKHAAPQLCGGRK